MSASNWTTCHSCALALATEVAAKIADQRQQLADAYGVLPHHEYLKLETEAHRVITEQQERTVRDTFREDYEIHGASTGTVTVAYGGQCQLCGYGVSFTHQHPIGQDAQPNSGRVLPAVDTSDPAQYRFVAAFAAEMGARYPNSILSDLQPDALLSRAAYLEMKETLPKGES